MYVIKSFEVNISTIFKQLSILIPPQRIHPFLRPVIPRWGEVDVRSYLTPTLDPQTQDASGKWKFIDL